MSLEDELAHLVRQGMQKAGLRKEVEDLKAERDALLAASQWQPIETAPKDGTWVLCFVPDNCPEYENTLVLRYVIGSWGRPGIGGYRPTYWQPLPNPPSPTL